MYFNALHRFLVSRLIRVFDPSSAVASDASSTTSRHFCVVFDVRKLRLYEVRVDCCCCFVDKKFFYALIHHFSAASALNVVHQVWCAVDKTVSEINCFTAVRARSGGCEEVSPLKMLPEFAHRFWRIWTMDAREILERGKCKRFLVLILFCFYLQSFLHSDGDIINHEAEHFIDASLKQRPTFSDFCRDEVDVQTKCVGWKRWSEVGEFFEDRETFKSSCIFKKYLKAFCKNNDKKHENNNVETFKRSKRKQKIDKDCETSKNCTMNSPASLLSVDPLRWLALDFDSLPLSSDDGSLLRWPSSVTTTCGTTGGSEGGDEGGDAGGDAGGVIGRVVAASPLESVFDLTRSAGISNIAEKRLKWKILHKRKKIGK
jgi:hypothetical protein